MKNKKIILISFIAIFVILVAVFLIQKFKPFSNKNSNVVEDNNNNNFQNNPSNTSNSNPIKATKVTTPTINKIYFNNLPTHASLPLSKGQKNQPVYLLQYILNALFNTGLVLDGDFGSKTQAALLKNTGSYIVDGSLILALNSEMQNNKNKIKNFDFYLSNISKFS